MDEPRILIVCTANQCRSPMAEVLLRDLLQRRGVAAAVASAGLLLGGASATTPAVEVAAARGLDLSSHRSRALGDTGVELSGADLVLTMERRHLQEAVLLAREVRDRTFTLVDAVRRAETIDPRHADESLASWVRRLGAGRGAADVLGVGDDGIDDPIGQPRARYEATATRLADLLSRLVDRAFPSAARGPA